MRYFINKLTNTPRQIGDYTPSVLNECLTATYQVGTEIIDGQQVEQPKLELVWKEITEQEYQTLTQEPQISQAEIDRQNKIAELKNNLSQTDYQAIKYAEGQITETDYEPIKQQRQEWRDEINKLEVENG